jgi:TPR repeat protein
MKAGDLGRLGFAVLFCGFQALVLLWLMSPDTGFIPDLPQAERLLDGQQYQEAVRHLRPLAAAGSVRANWLLGELYVNGIGVPRDVPRGVRYLERAADGNVLQAQFLLSRIYSYGNGVRKDLVRAHLWLSLAAAQDRNDGAGLLPLLEQMMTREQIERAWALAEQRVPGTRDRLRPQ